MAHPKVEALLKQGQSIWQDDIARLMLTSGKLAATIRTSESRADLQPYHLREGDLQRH